MGKFPVAWAEGRWQEEAGEQTGYLFKTQQVRNNTHRTLQYTQLELSFAAKPGRRLKSSCCLEIGGVVRLDQPGVSHTVRTGQSRGNIESVFLAG